MVLGAKLISNRECWHHVEKGCFSHNVWWTSRVVGELGRRGARAAGRDVIPVQATGMQSNGGLFLSMPMTQWCSLPFKAYDAMVLASFKAYEATVVCSFQDQYI